MDAHRIVDEQVWKVLLKIKEQEILSDWRELGVLQFGNATENEKKILFWLQDQRVIKLLNLVRTKGIINVPGDIAQVEGVKLKVIQSAFDEIYKEYDDSINQPGSLHNPKTQNAKAEIKDIILTKNLKGKEKLFLQAVSNMKPISLKDLSIKVRTKNCKALKLSVQRKIKNTGWSIRTIKATGLEKNSFYQLEFLTK